MKKLALLALSVVGAGAHAIVLDNFVDGSITSPYLSSVGDVHEAYTAATVAGGIRGTYLEVLANDDEEDARVRVRGMVTGGSFSVSAGPGVSVYAALGYGFDMGGLPTNNMNLDLSASPFIRLNFNSNDLPLNVQVDTASNGVLTSSTVSTVLASGSPFSQDFAINGGASLDVDQIAIRFLNAPSGDFSLSSVEAVPEPASMAILGLGIAAMARRRNRK